MDPQRSIRALLAAAFLAAAPALVLCDAAWALSRRWRPIGRIEHLVLLAAVAALGFVALVFAVPRPRRMLERRAPELILLVLSTAFGLLLLELGVARIDQAFGVRAEFHTRGPGHKVFDPAPGLMPGITGPTHYTTDARGVRLPGEEPAGHLHQILCIGGSTTECVYLDDARTWPALFMRHVNEALGQPRIWVGNVGFSGFATMDHLVFLRESRLMRGVDAVVIQPGINDLYPILADETLKLHVRDPLPEGPRPPYWAKAHLIQFYHAVRLGLPEGLRLESRDGSEYEERRTKRRAAVIRDDAPELDDAVKQYKSRLRHIVSVCQARGVLLVFTTQPVLWSDAMTPEAERRCWFGWLADGAYLSIPSLRTAIDRYNAALREVCEESKTPCVDLDSMNGSPEFFYDDCHFSEAGAAEVARRVADWFLRESGFARGIAPKP
ncbi:MAG TPA: SGNH/GDSL hydrolase family protein [Candidatus Hydrogenedentes bacterium]|nr:SGNH/GDSL hydrolase family protein [Candidatus Hydrogenedentota bacterium]HPG65370.1 SGNH/GDSL hydrolase family protein [Candidatus Hydrogenedentota bacterium]